MVDIESIRELISRIVHEYQPTRIILFGSYAYGTPDTDSDVDLLIILSHEGKNSRKAIEILNQLNPEIPVDLLVRTPEQIQRRLALNDLFLREVLEKGQVLYEAAHP